MSDRDFTNRLSGLAENAARTGTLGPAADIRRRGDQRRRRQRTLTGVLSAVVLIGALGAGVAFGQHHSTSKLGPPAGSAASSPSVGTPSKPPWTGTKKFMQVQSGQINGGVVTLTVRPAKKVILGESFETQPLAGPYTEVALGAQARILLLDGESGTAESFVGALGTRTAQQLGEGFDITFDTEGKVALVEWLYTP